MLYNYSAKKDVGKIRSEQQDDLLVMPQLFDRLNTEETEENYNTRNGALFIVADGMGGGTNGALASQLAVEGVKEYFILNKEQVLRDSLSSVKKALVFANAKIRNHILQHEEDSGMGSTIVIGLVVDNTMYLGWIGDSRCYIFDDKNKLIQISKDHSYVQSLIDENKLTYEQAFYHPKRNIITQSLGMESLNPSLEVVDLSSVGYLLLCSDGLTSMLTDTEIEKVLTQKLSADFLNKQLVERANEAGGEDNISSLLVEFTKTPENTILSPKTTVVLNKRKWNKKNPRLKYFIIVLLILSVLLVFLYTCLRFVFSENTYNEIFAPKEVIRLNDLPDNSSRMNAELENQKINTDSFTYYVRINVFSEQFKAENLMERLVKKDEGKDVSVRLNDNGLYEVCVFGFLNKEEATEYLRATNEIGGVVLYQN